MKRKHWTLTPWFIIFGLVLLLMATFIIPYNVGLFYLELGIAVLAFGAVIALSLKFRSYIRLIVRTTAEHFVGLDADYLENYKFPVAVSGEKGDIIWCNARFRKSLCGGKSPEGDDINAYIPGFSIANDFLLIVIETLVSTAIVIVIGEFVPKTLFRSNPNGKLNILAFPIYLIYIILYPISLFTTWLSRIILRMTGVRIDKDNTVKAFSKVDLDYFVQSALSGKEEDSQPDQEVRIFQNVLDFSNVKTRDCMVPRNDIVAVDVTETSRDDLVSLFSRSGLSKIVVYRGEIDNVIGFIQVSELFVTDVDWKTRIKPVIFAPETLLARKMMTQLMEQKRSMAIVLDEFGGTSGMVTLEDLVEEIFGEIEDEHDRNSLTARQIDDTTYELSGRMEIEEINERFQLDIPESDDYQTIAGFLLFNHGALPAQGEPVDIGRYTITVTHKTAARIELLRLHINPQPEE